MATAPALPTFPQTAEVLKSLQAALQNLNSLLTNFNNGGVTETYLEALALLSGSDASTYPNVVTQSIYELLTIVQNSAFALTATGASLDNKAADVGLSRKPASYSSGPVVFTPTTISSVPNVIGAGALVAAESADPTALPVVYRTMASVTIPANSSAPSESVLVQAVNAGANGNQSAPGAINTVISGATGVTVTSTDIISGGSDTEQDDEPNGGLRARVLAAIPNASQGTLAALEGDAKSYAGVVDAVATDANIDPTIPLGVVNLYIDDGSGDLGNLTNQNNAIVQQMQSDFDSGKFRAAGVEVNVAGSRINFITSIGLTVSVNQSYATSQSDLRVVAGNVQTAVAKYVNGLGIGKPVLVAEIVAAATAVNGVSDVVVTSVTINGYQGNVSPGATFTSRIASSGLVSVIANVVNY
jgi:uncharacterized phage protein gp47/JayE